MRFFNREKEIKEILSLLEDEPNNIYFIFGSINSGKTTLMKHIIENKIDKDRYITFYINLREHFISKYDDFIEILFEEYSDDKESLIKNLIKDISLMSGIPIPKNTLNELLNKKRSKNVFKYILDVFENLYREGKQPILIIDELQKIGDMKINGFLIYELFNFFIDLTKEKHLCHVLCLSSDSLFIEKVYDKAMLRDRVDYILVDDFDEETALKFIDFYAKEKNIKLDEKEKELIYSYVGGKPILIIKVINKMKVKDINNILDELLKVEISKLENLLEDIKEGNYNVNYEEVIESLKLFKDTYSIPKSKIKKDIRNLLIKKNYLFLNPITNEVKPQSFLIWNAIKRIL